MIQISYWVATEIVMCPILRKRITILKRFIHIAEQCKKFNNLSSALAIVCGLNLGCIQRLKKTWEGLPRQYHAVFSDLTDLMSSLSNFRHYRRHIKTVEPPAIPYIAVTLKDLTFIEDGNPNFRQNGMVNFEKMTMLANVFAHIQKYQMHEYPFVEVPETKDLLTKNLYVIKGDKELYRHSTMCETEQGARIVKSPSHQDVSTISKGKCGLPFVCLAHK
jgi:son of sevenless-like protein